mmetsp:Transcript_11371/g.31483  ORF Transcript_11371/g.31483 Transcript_11371/m.31483 type:complete len:217 (+) Transcript_11371:433-1083(+)
MYRSHSSRLQLLLIQLPNDDICHDAPNDDDAGQQRHAQRLRVLGRERHAVLLLLHLLVENAADDVLVVRREDLLELRARGFLPYPLDGVDQRLHVLRIEVLLQLILDLAQPFHLLADRPILRHVVVVVIGVAVAARVETAGVEAACRRVVVRGVIVVIVIVITETAEFAIDLDLATGNSSRGCAVIFVVDISIVRFQSVGRIGRAEHAPLVLVSTC